MLDSGSRRINAPTFSAAAKPQVPSGVGPGLDATVNFETSALTCGIGVHAAELEVDPLTGGMKLLKYVVVNDCGRVINPMTAEGQIHGGGGLPAVARIASEGGCTASASHPPDKETDRR